MSISWHVGDILDAKVDAILHQTNCKGVMGGGLALQIRKKFPEVYDKYRAHVAAAYRVGRSLLGSIQIVQPTVARPVIINVFGQDEHSQMHRCTSYDALEAALSKAAKSCAGTTVAIPYKMSCGLAGGNWEIVKAIIRETIAKTCEVQIWRLTTVPLDQADIPGELRYFGISAQTAPHHSDKILAIRGIQKPTLEEAARFLNRWRPGEVLNAYATIEYSKDDAAESFNFDDEPMWPVFGLEVVE